MKRSCSLILLLLLAPVLWGQTKILGRVVDADSHAIALATVRLFGLDTKQTDSEGYFQFIIPPNIARAHAIRAGGDLNLEVQKAGMVMLEPPDGIIRLPHNWNYQKGFRIVLCRQGSPLLARSERMLEFILRQKIQAAVEDKENELARRDVLAEQAQRLGLNKETLLDAVAEYKDRLRTSTDLNLRGLAALDDANEAADAKTKQQKLTEAKQNFREAIAKDEEDVKQGQEAETRLPDTYYNMGLTFFNEARYDSAAFFFVKADSAEPGDTQKMNMLGRAWDELAQHDQALAIYQRALAIDTTVHGRNHPNVATRLNNIALVLEAKGDYAGALEKYEEALKIVQSFHGQSHPYVAATLNNIAGVLEAKGDYAGALEKYEEALKIDESYFGRNHPNVARELNNIAGVLRAKGDYAGALAKYEEALKIFIYYFGPEHPNTKTVAENLQALKDSLNKTQK